MVVPVGETLLLPDVLFFAPVHAPPLAVQESAPVTVQDNVEDAPALISSGLAVRLTDGRAPDVGLANNCL